MNTFGLKRKGLSPFWLGLRKIKIIVGDSYTNAMTFIVKLMRNKRFKVEL